jgi:hypothetical protein
MCCCQKKRDFSMRSKTGQKTPILSLFFETLKNSHF